MDFTDQRTVDFIQRSLQEDVGSGDHSSLAAIKPGTGGTAELIFKEDGIAAGVELARAILYQVDQSLHFEAYIADGDLVENGTIGFRVKGSVQSILKAERLLLNCMQRLSGIATITNRVVRKVEGTGTRILDTRKTTPGLRFLEKWAVTVGGGHNHREGLYDMIMLKDNHIDYAGGISIAVERVKSYLATHGLNLRIEVETRNLKEVSETLEHPEVFRIMLDNFTPDQVKEAVEFIDGRAETEASGGITIHNVREYAETGVDFISIGALTHSVKSLDISLKEV